MSDRWTIPETSKFKKRNKFNRIVCCQCTRRIVDILIELVHKKDADQSNK